MRRPLKDELIVIDIMGATRGKKEKLKNIWTRIAQRIYGDIGCDSRDLNPGYQIGNLMS
jgi:hypothetical protein